jgi:hypothetical protein
MSSRRVIDWPAVFAWMRDTGNGPRAAARHFELPPGTVLAAVTRERDRAKAPTSGRIECPMCGAAFEVEPAKAPEEAEHGT